MRWRAVRPGFRPDHVLSGRLSIPGTAYPTGASIVTFTERVWETLSQQPGIHVVGLATNIPLSGMNIMSAATPLGWVPAAGESPRGHF